MKQFITLFAWILCTVGILFTQSVLAQSSDEPCGTMEYLAKQKRDDPTLEARMQQQEEWLQQRIAERRAHPDALSKATSVITIPVVVHILYNTTEENIPDQRVYDQLAISNRDFAGLNPHSMGVFPHALKANTNIQFCLAQKAPDGSATSGIERRYTTKTGYGLSDSMKYYSTGGLDAWDPTLYMNIWVCRLDGYLGYAYFPGGSMSAKYGAVVDYIAFGLTDTTTYSGCVATTTHELGHCLNLYHIWGNASGDCTSTDYCNDTPNQFSPTWGVYSGLLTDACSPVSPGIMYMNFMDYSGFNIMANFTPNQATRMQTTFAAPSGPLLRLLASTACSAPTSCETPTALKTTSLTRTTATVAWTAMVNSSGYNIRYRKIGITNWTNTTSSTNSKLITGLTKNTSYEFQVQNVCTGTSPFSSSFVFKTPKTGPAKEVVDDEIVVPTSVVTVYPNPASSNTTITFALASQSYTSLIIFDALGREVTTLISESLPTGMHTRTWNAEQLPQGIYFCRISSDEFNETRMIVLQK